MSKHVRQRTKAQRNAQIEEEEPLVPSQVLDEQTQSEEIRLLRQKNSMDNKQAQMVLDVGVLIATIISIMQFFEHTPSPNPIFCILAVIQLLLLPFSITPRWLPIEPISPDIHLYTLSVELTVSVCAIYIRYNLSLPSSGAGMEPMEVGEMARWIMPALVSGAVNMQRRAERQSEMKLDMLEELKYDLKGA
ncbi:uncharacterized protein IL334_004581 [Kwoniella shivajii]|uniref:Uncharacterized protein n=1 Tax=Kwoniella shivajii TaxID=564305 RepID=A0ABZ1D2N1_9TREE|nr:hypothetical protein IL334_004581 [Kwoniella shivajii]